MMRLSLLSTFSLSRHNNLAPETHVAGIYKVIRNSISPQQPVKETSQIAAEQPGRTLSSSYRPLRCADGAALEMSKDANDVAIYRVVWSDSRKAVGGTNYIIMDKHVFVHEMYIYIIPT